MLLYNLLLFHKYMSSFLALLPAIILELGAFEPFHRGYFCSDDSIRYPFKKSTIPYGVVVFIGLGVPSFAVGILFN